MKNKKKINKNELYACILACLIILWSIASVLGTIAFFRTRNSSKMSTISASAQTPAEISKDGFLAIEMPFLNGFTLHNGKSQSIVYSRPELLILNNALLIRTHSLFQFGMDNNYIAVYGLHSYQNGASGIVTDNIVNPIYIVSSKPYDFIFPSLYEFKAIFLDYFFYYNAESYTFDVDVTLRWNYQGKEDSFNFIMKYPFGDVFIHDPNWVTPSEDIPNNSGGCYLPFSGTSVSVLETREIRDTLGYGIPTADFLNYYRLTGTLSPDALLTYEMAYDKGFAEGKQVGLNSATGNAFSEGEFAGYERGKKEGLAQGKAEGYQQGLNDGNAYTFGNLLSAGFDVPIKAFTGLFNFDFLGVNLFNFFTALFTAALIIAVLRIFL